MGSVLTDKITFNWQLYTRRESLFLSLLMREVCEFFRRPVIQLDRNTCIEEETECTAAARTVTRTKRQDWQNNGSDCPPHSKFSAWMPVHAARESRSLSIYRAQKSMGGHARASERRMEILEERERADLDISLFAPSHLRAAPYIGIRSS